MQAVSNRWVGKIEFLFHSIDFPFTAYEGYDEIQVFSCQMGEGASSELSLNRSITRLTMEASNRQFGTTNRATCWSSVHKRSPERQFTKSRRLIIRPDIQICNIFK